METPDTNAVAAFEAKTWQPFPTGWRQLHGDFPNSGVSIEWHDIKTRDALDWGASFHPESLEICLNLRGQATVSHGDVTAQFNDMTAGFYACGNERLVAQREPNQRHQFVTIELSQSFVRREIQSNATGLAPLIRSILNSEESTSGVGPPAAMSARQERIVKSLRQPPVLARAQGLWYRGKALEVVSEFLFQQEQPEETLFCIRQKTAAKERVARVMKILHQEMDEPPTLEELGKRIGCSHYYLSRTFSKETGTTIPQYLRQIRIAKAAELLRAGRLNVTQVAMEVGYSSLSHFSHAFRQETGYCPGLYPAKGKRTN